MPRSTKPSDTIRGRVKPKKKPVRVSKSRLEKRANVKLTECTLQQRHVINGLPYGPGAVKVPREVAYALLELDRKAAQVEAALYAEKAVMILSNRLAVPVAPANFQSIWAGDNSPIFYTQSGKGVIDVRQAGQTTF